MRTSLLRSLALLATVALLTPASAAQETVLFNFEGNGGDTEGWEPTQDADSIATNNSAAVGTRDAKVINGAGDTLPAFNGTWMLEATPNTPLKAHTFRGAKYTWPTSQDWSATPLLRVAASMQARGANSEIHEYRVRVISGTGAAADTLEMVYEGLKSEEFDAETNNTFVNEWEVLELDLFGWAGLSSVTQIEAAGRNFDDGTINSPTTGNATPGPNGNWGGLVHVDFVTVEAAGAIPNEPTPGLRSLGDVYPNPTASGASLAVEVETAQRVTATVYDVLGREVATAFEGTLAPGATSLLRLEVSDLVPGRYVVRLQGETFTASRTLSVVR